MKNPTAASRHLPWEGRRPIEPHEESAPLLGELASEARLWGRAKTAKIGSLRATPPPSLVSAELFRLENLDDAIPIALDIVFKGEDHQQDNQHQSHIGGDLTGPITQWTAFDGFQEK